MAKTRTSSARKHYRMRTRRGGMFSRGKAPNLVGTQGGPGAYGGPAAYAGVPGTPGAYGEPGTPGAYGGPGTPAAYGGPGTPAAPPKGFLRFFGKKNAPTKPANVYNAKDLEYFKKQSVSYLYTYSFVIEYLNKFDPEAAKVNPTIMNESSELNKIFRLETNNLMKAALMVMENEKYDIFFNALYNVNEIINKLFKAKTKDVVLFQQMIQSIDNAIKLADLQQRLAELKGTFNTNISVEDFKRRLEALRTPSKGGKRTKKTKKAKRI